MCIFARQLSAVLAQRGKELGSLYAIHWADNRKIHPNQILRLKQVADGDCSISVALNPDELNAVIQAFKLDNDEVRRLHAALAAESFYRFFIDRAIDQVGGDQMLELAEQFFHVMLSGDAREFGDWKEVIFEDIRPISDEEAEPLLDREAQIAHDMESAIELYEEAQLWLVTARSSKSASRRIAYTQLALALLGEAQELLRYPTGIVANTPECAEWLDMISTAIATAQAGMSQSS
ncbi:MAG TPA: hypothetical protein VF725_05310 [Ktedonobacterales bacterium]